MESWFSIFLGALALIAGAIAAVTSTGVGSLLTPALAIQLDMHSAILAVALPHLIFNALRSWPLRRDINWKLLKRFGVTSAAGSLVGAFLQRWVSSPWLSRTFAGLLVVVGILGVMGATERLHLGKKVAWVGGAGSGFFGGLTGEQGGLRTGVLLGFEDHKESFIATGTATALLVDSVRLPVYVVTQWGEIGEVLFPTVLASGGVVLGALIGSRLLRRVPQAKFGRIVSAVVLGIGVLMVVRSLI